MTSSLVVGKLPVRTSQDYGSTWREEAFAIDDPIQEPAGCIYDGKLILMPRTGRATEVVRTQRVLCAGHERRIRVVL